MKKYVFEATKKQRKEAADPKYVFCETAKVTAFANSEEEAKALAEAQLGKDYYGSDIIIGEPRLFRVSELPIDWCYNL